VKFRIAFGTSVLTALFLTSSVRAAVVTVDVTIKAVNPQSRGIAVIYTAGAEEKAIELDVSRKAEIIVNEKEGTLTSLGPGMKAKVSYDKELAVVTKIEAVGTMVAHEVCRFTLQISEVGDAVLRIERTSTVPEDNFPGKPLTLSRWPHTKAAKGRDGIFRFVHDFREADDLITLSFQEPQNISLDREVGVLTFTPGRLPSSAEGKLGAAFKYGKRQRFPLAISSDINTFGGGEFCISVYSSFQPFTLLSCKIISNEEKLTVPFKVDASWAVVGEDRRGRRKTDVTKLVEESSVTVDRPFEKKFRLPLPSATITELYNVALGMESGKKPTTVSRLEVQGRAAPSFGIAFDEKESVVFAKKVFEKSTGEKAGFQAGDILLAVNGKRPSSMKDAVDMLSRLPIGEKVAFTIGRANRTHKLSVVAE
jgi:hypothetical protein